MRRGPPIRVLPALGAGLLLASWGCASEDPFAARLTETLALRATASGAIGSERAACTLAATIEVSTSDARGWEGTVRFGEVQRVLTDAGGGSSFSATVAGPATLARGADGRVTLRWVGDQPPDAAPLWRALAAMSGSERDPLRYEGRWECAPTGVVAPGSVDTLVVAEGGWTLEPP